MPPRHAKPSDKAFSPNRLETAGEMGPHKMRKAPSSINQGSSSSRGNSPSRRASSVTRVLTKVLSVGKPDPTTLSDDKLLLSQEQRGQYDEYIHRYQELNGLFADVQKAMKEYRDKQERKRVRCLSFNVWGADEATISTRLKIIYRALMERQKAIIGYEKSISSHRSGTNSSSSQKAVLKEKDEAARKIDGSVLRCQLADHFETVQKRLESHKKALCEEEHHAQKREKSKEEKGLGQVKEKDESRKTMAEGVRRPRAML